MLMQINHVDVYCEIDGNAEAEEKIVFLHGWGCDSQLMKPLADKFSDRYRTLLIDFPGHGKSSRPDTPWGVPEYAECLMTVINLLGFTPCHVIAHSFGARVAAWIASGYPEFFDKIILTGAAGIRPRETRESIRRRKHYQHMKNILQFFGGAFAWADFDFSSYDELKVLEGFKEVIYSLRNTTFHFDTKN